MLEAMASKSSIVRPTRFWPAVLAMVPYAALVAALSATGMSFYPSALLFGTLLFLLYRLIVVRRVVCRDHRRGVVLLKRGRFEEGLAAFERSEAVWRARPVLDRYRALILGSATPYRFEILARYNQAYALSRLGRGNECLDRLASVLEDDPSMMQAKELRDVLLAGSVLHPDVGEAMSGEVDGSD
jgi:hypothetical protein